MSTRLGAAPRTPTNDRRPKIRRFGTVLSVNSPGTTPSIPSKHARIRSEKKLTTITIPEENEETPKAIDIHESESSDTLTTKYTVTFEAGPIGLQIDPTTWCVQQFIGTDSPASQMIDTIAVGDIVVAVNGILTTLSKKNGDDEDNYDDIFGMLQDVTTRRTISFQRHSHNSDHHSNSNTLDIVPTDKKVIPTNDLENRKPIPGTAKLSNNSKNQLPLSPVPQHRLFAFGNHRKSPKKTAYTTHRSSVVTTTEPLIQQSSQTGPGSSSIQDELELTRIELSGANNQLQQLQMRLQEIETENEFLRHQQQQKEQQDNSNPPLNAIREMEYKMRIQSLEDQLRQSNESKAKVKEHNKRINQMLVHQSENHQLVVSQKEEEIHDAAMSLKNTNIELETTRKQLVDINKQRNDEVDLLKRDNDKLQSALDQKTIDLERYVAAKVQSDVQIQQLEEVRIDLNDIVQRLRDRVEETEIHAQGTNDEFLHVIRTKDEEMEQLRIEMVNTQSINAKLHTDLTEKDAMLRQMTTEIEQVSIEKHSITKEVMNLSSTLEITFTEKERLTVQVSQLESKVIERNNTIEDLKESKKVIQDESAEILTMKDEAMAILTESMNTVCVEREHLQQQLLDARKLLEQRNHDDLLAKSDLTATRTELQILRQSGTNEKCILLKQLEGLEGELIACRQEIKNHSDIISELTDSLESVTTERNEARCQLDTEQKNIALANIEIQRLKTTTSEWEQRCSILEAEYGTATESLQGQLDTAIQSTKDITASNVGLMRQVTTLRKSLMSACQIEMKLRDVQKQAIIETSALLQTLEQKRDQEQQIHSNEVNYLRSKLLNSENLHESLSIERNAALSKVVLLESEIVRLRSDVVQFESAWETTTIQSIQMDISYQTLAESTFACQQELRDKLALRKTQLQQLIRKYNDLKDANRKNIQSLLDATETSVAQEEEILRVREHLTASTTSLERLEESTRFENNELCETIRAMEVELGDTNQRLELSEKSLMKANADLASAKSTEHNLLIDVSTLKDQCQELYSKADIDRSTFVTKMKLMNENEQELSEKIRFQSEQLSQSETQRQALDDELLKLRDVILAKDRELSESHSTIQDINAKLEILSSALTASESALLNMSSSAQNTELTIVTLKQSIISKQEEVNLKMHELEVISELVVKLESENKNLLSEISRKEAEVAQMEVELKQIVATNYTHSDTIVEREQAIMDLQLQYDSACATKDIKIEAVINERNETIAECLELRETIDNLKDNEYILQSEIDQLRFQLVNSEADFQKSEELRAVQASGFDNVQRKFTEQKNRADKLLRELQQSESSIDSLSRLLDSANAQVVSLKKTQASKQKVYEKKFQLANTELNNSLKSNEVLTTANSDHSDKISNLEFDLLHAKEVSNALQQKLNTVESELSVYVASAGAAASDFLRKKDALQRDNIELNSTIESRDSRIDSLSEHLDSTKQEVKQLTQLLSESKDELQNTKQKISILQMKLDESKQNEACGTETWSAKIIELTKQHAIRLSVVVAEKSDMDQELRALRSAKDVTIYKCESLKLALYEEESRNDILSQNLATTELELQQLKEGLADSIERSSTSEAQLREKAGLLSAAEDRIAEADAQVSVMEGRIEILIHESSIASDSFAAEINRLNVQFDATQLESNHLERNLNLLQKQLFSKDVELERLVEEARVHTETVNGITASAAASQWTLECKIDALNLEVEKYHELSSDLNSECSGLKDELASLHEKIKSLSEAHSFAVTTFETVKLKMSEHQKEAEEKVVDEKVLVSQLTDQLHVLKLERNREQSEAATNMRQFEETIRLLQHEADLRSRRQIDWTKDREMERAQFQSCREELQEATDKISHLHDCLAKANEEVQSLITQSEQTNEENVSILEQQDRSHSAEKHLLQKQNERLQKDVRASSSECISVSLRLLSTEDKLATFQSEIDSVVKEKKVLSSTMEEQAATIEMLQSMLQGRDEPSLDASIDSALKSMSKNELKNRCSVLQDELVDAEKKLMVSNDVLNRRSEHVKQLSDDLGAMSSEISRLVAANELLESRLQELASRHVASEDSISNARIVICGLETQLKNRLEKLDAMSVHVESLTDEFQSSKMQSKSERRTFANDKLGFEQELFRLQQELEFSAAKTDQATNSLNISQQELLSMRKNEEHLISTRKELKDEIETMSRVANNVAETGKEMKDQVSFLEDHILNLESKCSTLRSVASELRLELETKEMALKDCRESERLLGEELAKQKKSVSVADRQREEIVAKLTEATRVVASQRLAIKKLELRSTESNRIASELTEQVEALQAENQLKETKIDSSQREQNQQFHDMETKIGRLDRARHVATQDVIDFRDDLRKLRQELSETEKSNDSLKNQLRDSLSVNEFTKAQLAEAKSLRDNAQTSLRKLTNEVDNKQMEIDHLKAKVQVSTATAARMKANVLLLQSAHLKEIDTPSSGVLEIESLKGELKDRSSKLTSISELYKSQEEALSYSVKLESQLVRFIDEIIVEMDNVLCTIALRTEGLYEYVDQYQLYDGLKSLDLAGFDHQERNSEALRRTLDGLSVLIPHAATQLDERRAQIHAWKGQRSDHNPSIISTPTSKRTDSMPATPEILDTLHRMKNFLKTDILSPIKIRTSHSDQLDVEFFKQVIRTLEGNVDVLLQDMQAANVALHEKDERISELEMFVASCESSEQTVPSPLDLFTRNDPNNDAPENESDSKTESSLSTKRRSIDVDDGGRKRAAGRLLLNALEGRTNAAKAVAFRRWSCRTNVLRTMAKHGHTASALAQQLEETREKLMILKRHLKKARRTGGGSGRSLDRIPEHEFEV